jgi:hypothetical protein
MKREMLEKLRSLRAGDIQPGSREGQDIISQAFKEDRSIALRMTEAVPKTFLERGMKLAGFTTAEIGHILHRDPMDREAFYARERRLSDRIGAIGHDDFGYPAGFGAKDAFDAGPSTRALSEADPSWTPIEEEPELDDDPTNPFPSPDEVMRRGPRPR